MRLIVPQWRWALLGICLSLAALLANMALLALSSWFIASMAIAGSAGIVMEYSLASTGVRALALARAGGRYLERLVNHGTTFRILTGLRVWFFRRIEPLSPARLERYRSGDLLSRIRADIDTLDDFYVRGVVPMIVALLAAAFIFAFLARFDARLAWIDAAALASAGVLLPLALRRLAERPGRERVLRAADLRASVVEQVHGMAELIALGVVEERGRRIMATSREMDGHQRALSSFQGIGDSGLIAAASLAVWGAALILVPEVVNGGLPRADLAMLTVFVLASFEAIMPLPVVFQKAGEMAAAARRLFEIIDAEPAVSEPAAETIAVKVFDAAGVTGAFHAVQPTGAVGVSGAADAIQPAGAPAAGAKAAPSSLGLSIRDLRFRYESDLPWVFDGLSLEVPPGSRIAIVGPTGAGKSTLVSILLRFREYEVGSIRLVEGNGRGYELRGLRGEEARSLFSVVPQSPYLFHSTIRENLLIAASLNEEAIHSALAAAQLETFISRLPDGLDTIVGETGAEVSGGELKRIAVARALLKEAPVYVLDEPTEGLDEGTADALLSAVEEKTRGRTLIIISHRARDISLAQEVIRLAGREGSKAGHSV
jgi:ATP-binding cassette subfamily C protein CydC